MNNEIISQVGRIICPLIQEKFEVARVVNSGFGVYTVFMLEKALSNIEKLKIVDICFQAVKKEDFMGVITNRDSLVSFDTIKRLENEYGGNLYYYYK